MNKKVLTVAILAVVALVIVYLYSFGPLAGKRQAARPSPQSVMPTTGPATSQGVSEYHNHDVKENYYGIALPQTWQIASGKTPGSYTFSFPVGTGSIGLIDIPDNSTPELFILSREEPRLRKTLPGYARRSYTKTTVGGSEAYELLYLTAPGGVEHANARVYVSGQDMAVVAAVTATQPESLALAQALNAVVAGFKWENR